MSTLCSLSFERASTPGQTQTELGRGFILLLRQDAVLPGSNAGSDGVNPILLNRFRAIDSSTAGLQKPTKLTIYNSKTT